MSCEAVGKLRDKIVSFFSDESNFRFVFVAALLCASLNVIRFWFYVAAGICMIWAAFLFGYRLIYQHRIRRIRNRRLILLFLGSALLTCFIQFSSNFIVNIYLVAWMGICFFMFYGIHADKSRRSCSIEVSRILDLINAVTTIIMTTGIILLIIFPKGFVIDGDSFAIHENRFVGIIFNANVTAFYALMALISCNLLLVIRKSLGKLNGKLIAFYIICSVINLFSLFISDSNASLLMLIVYLCFVSFYVIFKGYKRGFISLLFRIIALILACIVATSFLLGTRTLVQGGTSAVLSMLSPHTQISTGVTSKPDQNIIIIKPDDRPETTFEHQNTNIDSGRFKIWRQSAEMFRLFPVFGVGKGNVVDYGKTYLGGLRYEDFHNGLITIAVCYGSVGLMLFMVLAITIGKSMLKAIFRYRNENRRDCRVLMYITAFCAGYCVYSMFEVALLVDISYRVVIFWLLIGLAMSYVGSYERNAITAGENIPERSRSIRRVAAYLSNSRT